MKHFFLDASALIKRYHPEVGTQIVNQLVDKLLSVSPDRLIISQLGIAEVVSVLNRKRNAGQITDSFFKRAASSVLSESKTMFVEFIGPDVIPRSIPLISQHNLNASDALYLRQILDWQAQHGPTGNQIALVAADQRLLRAADRESIACLDPEAADLTAVETLLNGQ